MFGRNSCRSLARVGLPGTSGAGWLVPHMGKRTPNLTEVEHSVGESNWCRQGSRGGVWHRHFLTILTEALGCKHSTRERAGTSSWLLSPGVQLNALYSSAECERVRRARTLPGRKLEQLLRRASRQQMRSSS